MAGASSEDSGDRAEPGEAVPFSARDRLEGWRLNLLDLSRDEAVVKLRQQDRASRAKIRRRDADNRGLRDQLTTAQAGRDAEKEQRLDAERANRELTQLLPRHDSRSFLVVAGISCDDLGETGEDAVVTELLDRVAELERRNVALTATVDGLQAQVAALSAGVDSESFPWET
jgi:hypothetical protein